MIFAFFVLFFFFKFYIWCCSVWYCHLVRLAASSSSPLHIQFTINYWDGCRFNEFKYSISCGSNWKSKMLMFSAIRSLCVDLGITRPPFWTWTGQNTMQILKTMKKKRTNKQRMTRQAKVKSICIQCIIPYSVGWFVPEFYCIVVRSIAHLNRTMQSACHLLRAGDPMDYKRNNHNFHFFFIFIIILIAFVFNLVCICWVCLLCLKPVIHICIYIYILFVQQTRK